MWAVRWRLEMPADLNDDLSGDLRGARNVTNEVNASSITVTTTPHLESTLATFCHLEFIIAGAGVA